MLRNKLTAREREVLEATLLGGAIEELAQAMILTRSTVKFHLTNIYKKHNVKGYRQLMSHYILKYRDIVEPPRSERPEPCLPYVNLDTREIDDCL